MPHINLTILGGFLGAGKTTWLRHQLHMGLKTHILINEAAGTPVDDALLTQATGQTVLTGCACCTGKPALIKALRVIANRRSQGYEIPDLTLETSGLADPAAILDAITQDPILTHHIRIKTTTVLVDAQHLGPQIPALALKQMRAADHLILTKNDTIPPAQTAQAAATLRAINPLAQISAATQGVPTDLPTTKATPLTLTADTHHMQATTLTIPENADWPALSLWLSGILHAHGDHILRVKGVIRSPAGRLLIQTVRHFVQQPELLPDGLGTDDALAIIGHSYDPATLTRSLTRFLA